MMFFDIKIRCSIYICVLKYFPYKTYIFALYMYDYMVCCCVIHIVVYSYYLYDSTNMFSCVYQILYLVYARD